MRFCRFAHRSDRMEPYLRLRHSPTVFLRRRTVGLSTLEGER